MENQTQEQKQYKNIPISITGKLTEFKKREDSQSIRLISENGASEWCYYHGTQDINEWVNKNVVCFGTMSKTVFRSNQTDKIIGYGRSFSIFRIIEKKPKPKNYNTIYVDE